MADIAVSVSAVTKTYRLYASHQERLKEALHPFRRHYHEEFSALSEVSFDIKRGASVGILGRNGAGKSTLLQLIAGVLTPTSGTIKVAGKVAALLELGAGFNPDLTGRENVVLASTILGIEEGQIPERVAAVEAFADIGMFFDQPLKVYSSGMYARVAFANAIDVKPDVLIIDEILGVGDAKFQEKCYSKIRELKDAGACILFVSHSTDVVQRNCECALLMENGRLVIQGAVDGVIAAYHDILYGAGLEKTAFAEICNQSEGEVTRTRSDTSHDEQLNKLLRNIGEPLYRNLHWFNPNQRRFGNGDAEIVDFLVTADGNPDFHLLSGSEVLGIYLKVRFVRAIAQPEIGWAIASPEGIVIAGSNTAISRHLLPHAHSGETWVYKITVQLAFCGGDYFLNFGVGESVNGTWTFLDNRRSAVHLSVTHQESTTGFFHLPSTCEIAFAPSHYEH